MEIPPRRRSWDIANLDSPFHTVVLVCLVATLSYVSTALGLLTRIDPTINIAPLWPTNALLLVVLLAVPRRVWPILIVTAYVVVALLDLQSGDSIASTFWLVLANVIEVLIAALGVSYFFKNVPGINSTKTLAQYSLFAVILAPFVGAFVAGPAGAQGNYWLHWKIWFLSDSLPLLTLPPAVWGLVHLGSKWRHKSRAIYLELAALIATLGLFGYNTFVASVRSRSPALLYILVPFLLWSVFRFGAIGVSASVIVVAVLSIWGAVQGRGPFTEPGPVSNVLSLQMFLLFTAVPFMVLAALIEERRRAEEELREGEDKLRLLLESTAEAIYGIDIEGRCTFCNPACLRSLGYERVDELLGKNMHDLIHHSRADGRMFPVEECRIFRAFQTGIGVHAENEVLWKADGKSFSAEYWAYPQLREGKIVGAVVAFIDITERKLAEEALRESEERLRLAVQAGKMYAFDWDVATDAIIRSEEAARIPGLVGEPIRLTKQQLLASVHPEDRATFINSTAERTPESPDAQITFRLLRPDGSILWLERTGHAFFDEQGRMVRMIGMVADVTERKLAEEALRRSEGYLSQAERLAHTGGWAWDVRTRETFWSKELFRLLGYDPEKTKPSLLNFLARVHPDDRRRAERRVEEEAAGLEHF
jgi:PAS domain S-box-containing protein